MTEIEGPAERKDALGHARSKLEGAEPADDEQRLEMLEELTEVLESELEASVENDAPGR